MDNTAKFFVKNCVLASLATGQRASSLFDLRDKLTTIDESSIYFHFWGRRMNPQFVHPQYHNDFAMWAHHHLHDQVLAEQLSVIDPDEFENMEELRQEIIDQIERRLDEHEIVFWTRKSDQFHFISSSIIIFETTLTISSPEDLPKVIAKLPPSSVFYHFIDARSRTQTKVDDFSVWLQDFGQQYIPLVDSIQAIDPYFLSLTQLKDELTKVTQSFFENREK